MNKPNLIMILLDGSRVDMLHTSPGLSSMKNEGTFFDQCIISSPYTVASVHSIFTGMYGSKNGVDSYSNMFGLKENVKTLAEYLKLEGYFTYGDIMSKAVLSNRGFDVLNVHDEHSIDMLEHHKEIIKNASSHENFFTFLQYSKIHTDSVINIAKKFDDLDESYFTKEQRRLNTENYKKSMKDAGEYRLRIMQFIEDLGLKSNSIIVFFSDHGTSTGEKYGEKMYGSFTYDYTIRSFVNFINSNIFPTKTVNYQIRTIDIMPTILDILGIKPDSDYLYMQGKSVMPLVYEKPGLFSKFFKNDKNRLAYIETGGLNGPWPSPDSPNVECLRTPNFKIIHNLTPNTWEFYDLENDSGEKNNLINESLREFKKMKKMLKKFSRD